MTPRDVAEVRLVPGLLALIGDSLGAGFEARYTVPVKLASTAAVALLAPVTPAGTHWASRDLEVEWFAAASANDTVLARARLEHAGDGKARFRIDGRTAGGTMLYRGTLHAIALHEGVPPGFATSREHAAERARLASLRAATPAVIKGDCLRLIRAPESIAPGASDWVEIELANSDDSPAVVTVTAHPPFGAGLSLDSPDSEHVALNPGETRRVRFLVRADRPHEVNFARPWEFTVQANHETLAIPIRVPDPDPGRIFYLLTEDCETFDGGPLTGDYARRGAEVFGNHNNFMDPEDYRIQMIRKPELMNHIAEKHGARWTHFYAATQRFAADWAAAQSSTGEWLRLAEEMDRSVREASKLHEYAPHVHFDYEPHSTLPPQPRLLYDPVTDGILPNCYYHPETNPTHCYHDWDGAARGIAYIKTLGDWRTLDTKTGSLRKTVRHLARLQANRRAPAVGRTGSYDFGQAPNDQRVSTHAYLANGLRGNSDAYRPGAPPMPGGQTFWCAEDDRDRPISDLREARLAQFAITMDTGFHSAAQMNEWFAAAYAAAHGPGVHALLFTTHAMFLAGAPDPFRSLEGGAFTELDAHLGWVREHYPDIQFATATEALLDYLDYYTPELAAHVEPLVTGGDPSAGRYEFSVRLLGQGIRVDEMRPATICIAAPLCFSPEELLEMRVKQDGRTLAETREFDLASQPALTVHLASRAPLLVELIVRPEAVDAACAWFRDEDGLLFHDPPEAAMPDLLRIRPPRAEEDGKLRIFPDVLRLLMNPVAGGAEPLGRRVHPMGGFAVGAALVAAFHATGATEPLRMKLRWVREVGLDSTCLAESENLGDAIGVRLRDDRGALVADAEIVVKPAGELG